MKKPIFDGVRVTDCFTLGLDDRGFGLGIALTNVHKARQMQALMHVLYTIFAKTHVDVFKLEREVNDWVPK